MCKFLDKSSYQIMFLIGVADILMLIIAFIPSAIWSLKGDVFCSQPTQSYVTGCLGMGFWVLSTESSAILAFYRCLELWRPFVADSLLKRPRTLLWIAFSLCHFTAVFFFGMPVLYSSIVGAFVLNPHVSYVEDEEGKFYNIHHRLYNMGLFVVLIGLYIAFVYLMACKKRAHVMSRRTLSTQYKALIQSLVICTCGAICDAYWVVVMLGPTPPQIVVFIGMYTSIFSHGVPGLIYISMNNSVRDSILKLVKIKKRVSPSRNVELDLIYIPTLSIIMRKFLNKSAYQLMFLIGVADVLMLIVALIPCGIWSLNGDVFCSRPTLTYVFGCFGMGFWVLSTESSAVLALYRCLELWRPLVADALFKGRRTLLWIGFSLCHSTAVFFFGMPVIYSSIDGAFEFNPHHSYIEDTEGKFYNLHIILYNMALFFVLIGLYIAFVYLVTCKGSIHGMSRQTLVSQYKALIQALIICTCGAIIDAYWVIALLGPPPPQIVVFIGMYTWICTHGVPGLIYITMNKSVRTSIFKVVKIKNRVSPSRNGEQSVNPSVQQCGSVK